jgi:hypothetical protein
MGKIGYLVSKITKISLDHDLGDDQALGTGLDVLRWIEERVATTDYVLPEISIHSMNPVGRRNMQLAIESINKIVSGKHR